MSLGHSSDCRQHVTETDSKTCTEQQEERAGTQEGCAGGSPCHCKGPQEPASGLWWRSRVCQFFLSAPGTGAQAKRSPWRWVRARKKDVAFCTAFSSCLLFFTNSQTVTYFNYILFYDEPYFQAGENVLLAAYLTTGRHEKRNIMSLSIVCVRK